MTVYQPQDLLFARRAKKLGARSSLRIILEARRARLPISLAFAVVDHETQHWLKGGNVFGCDHGAILCHEVVTKARVQRLIQHIRAGGVSNGVGFTQLTYPPFIYAAERLGGAHIVKNQLRVGFGHLADLLRHYGTRDGLAAYNGGSPGSRQGQVYARAILAKQGVWHRWLT